jgi:hypothetical protein
VKIYDLDQGSRIGALVALIAMPLMCIALAALWIRNGGQSSYLVLGVFALALCLFLVRVLWIRVHTWVEVGPAVVTWSTPPRASVHYSPSGSVPAEQIAVIAVETFKRTPSTPKGSENYAKLAAVLHLADGSRVVLPVGSGRETATVSILRLVAALDTLPGVPPIDVGPLAALARG